MRDRNIVASVYSIDILHDLVLICCSFCRFSCCWRREIYFWLCVTDLYWQEYVIVLLRNGRRKAEAINELNVFLGDDTNSFVSWYVISFSPLIMIFQQCCTTISIA